MQTVHTTIEIAKNGQDYLAAMKAVETIIDEDETNHFDLNKLLPKPVEFLKYRHPLAESLIYFLTDGLRKPLCHETFKKYDASDYCSDVDEQIESTKKWVEQYDESGVLNPQLTKGLPMGFKIANTLNDLLESGKAIVAAYDRHNFSNINAWCDNYWGNEWNTMDSCIDEDEAKIYFATKNTNVDEMVDLFAHKYNLTMIAYSMDEGRYDWNYRTYVKGELVDIEECEETLRIKVETSIYGEPEE